MNTLGKKKKIQNKKTGEFLYPNTVKLLPSIHPDTRREAEKKLPPFSRIEHKAERFNGNKWIEYDFKKILIEFTYDFGDNITLELNRDMVNMKNNEWLIKKLSKEGFNMSPNITKKNPVLRMVKPEKDDIILFIQGK